MNKTLMTALALTLLCGSSFAMDRGTEKCMREDTKKTTRKEDEHCIAHLKAAIEIKEEHADGHKKEMAILKHKHEKDEKDVREMKKHLEKFESAAEKKDDKHDKLDKKGRGF